MSIPSIDYEFLHIEPDFAEGRKTGVWRVYNLRHGYFLGIIEWSGNWRQYVFKPNADTIWSAGCLTDIATFLNHVRSYRVPEQVESD